MIRYRIFCLTPPLSLFFSDASTSALHRCTCRRCCIDISRRLVLALCSNCLRIRFLTVTFFSPQKNKDHHRASQCLRQGKRTRCGRGGGGVRRDRSTRSDDLQRRASVGRVVGVEDTEGVEQRAASSFLLCDARPRGSSQTPP